MFHSEREPRRDTILVRRYSYSSYCHVARDLSFACYLLRIRTPVHRLKSTQYGRYQSNRIERPFRFPSARSRRDAHRSDRLARGQDPSLYCAMPAPACREPSMCSTLPPAPQWRGGGAEISAEITPRDIARHTTTHCNTLDNTRTKRKHEMPVRCLIPRQGGAPACKPCGAPSP